MFRSSRYTACQISGLTANNKQKGVTRPTAVAAFVSASLRCSRKRTDVTTKPRMQINNDDSVRAREEELWIIRVFALQIAKGQAGLPRMERLSHKKCKHLDEIVSKKRTKAAIGLTDDIICFKSLAVSETCLRQGAV